MHNPPVLVSKKPKLPVSDIVLTLFRYKVPMRVLPDLNGQTRDYGFPLGRIMTFAHRFYSKIFADG